MTGPVMVTALPQELFTAGGDGTVCAAAIQMTVEPPPAGSVNVGGAIV